MILFIVSLALGVSLYLLYREKTRPVGYVRDYSEYMFRINMLAADYKTKHTLVDIRLDHLAALLDQKGVKTYTLTLTPGSGISENGDTY